MHVINLRQAHFILRVQFASRAFTVCTDSAYSPLLEEGGGMFTYQTKWKDSLDNQNNKVKHSLKRNVNRSSRHQTTSKFCQTDQRPQLLFPTMKIWKRTDSTNTEVKMNIKAHRSREERTPPPLFFTIYIYCILIYSAILSKCLFNIAIFFIYQK